MNQSKNKAPTNQCSLGLPNPIPLRYIPVWNEDKKEWQTLQCSEKLYKALQEARNELQRKYNTCREPYIVIGANGKLNAVLGPT